MKRIGIFFFYDKDGIVDKYIDVLLSGLKPYIERLVIVCNGKLTESGRNIFEQYTSEILVRDNSGFDVWAYKYALEYIHFESELDYDEIIMFNFTIFGPIYPFSEMFSKMDGEEVDFWGITKYHKLNFDPMKKIRYGYIPEHIQSHFLAIRRALFSNIEFINYWKNMPPVTTYDEAVSFHEAIFTKHFADLGFSWKTYIDTTPLDNYSKYPLMFMPLTLVKQFRCPILKRKTFFLDYWMMINESSGAEAREVFNYLNKNSLYDTRLILENLIRSENQTNWMNNLQLVEVISDSSERSLKELKIDLKQVCIAAYICGSTITQSILEYINEIPEESNLFVITTSAIEEEIKSNLSEKSELNIFIVPNNTSATAAFIMAAKKLDQYKLVCFVHDQIDQNRTPLSIDLFHLEQSYQNLILNSSYIEKVVSLFGRDDLLGIAFPPQPTYGHHGISYAHAWQLIFDEAKKILDQFDITIPYSPDVAPINTCGNMFWYRPEALQTPIPSDEYYRYVTKTDIVENASSWIYSLVAQNNGYYSAWFMNSEHAKTEIVNLDFLFRRERAYSIGSMSLRSSIVLYFKLHYPRLVKFLKPAYTFLRSCFRH
jgi:lipopolysaccharide biosynthesis protein